MMSTTPSYFSQLDDGKLIEHLIVGDKNAWRQFDQRYSKLIYRCISKILGRFDAGTDEIQEVYSTFCLDLLRDDFRKLRYFEQERGNKFTTWLGLLATHAAWDHLRKLRRQNRTDGPQVPETLPCLAPSPFDNSCSRQEVARLKEALTELSERDQTFVQLFFTEGLEPEAVAEMMGISVKTVYSKKHKIRARLSDVLQRPVHEEAA